jgi:3-hydroxyisobutyrate dehydrogenase-like beta-hydroxyacid dehydrogenase
MKPKIGFIGLGIMGRHMASHLLESGYEVSVFDIVKSAIDELLPKGVKR